MNKADRIIANQKAIKALGHVQAAAKEVGTTAKEAARSFAELGKVLLKSLPHQHEQN